MKKLILTMFLTLSIYTINALDSEMIQCFGDNELTICPNSLDSELFFIGGNLPSPIIITQLGGEGGLPLSIIGGINLSFCPRILNFTIPRVNGTFIYYELKDYNDLKADLNSIGMNLTDIQLLEYIKNFEYYCIKKPKKFDYRPILWLFLIIIIIIIIALYFEGRLKFFKKRNT